MGAVEKRPREELADLQVEINEEKSRIVDLGRGESFGFLGFDFRRICSRRASWRANYTPKLKKRTALLRKLRDVLRRYQLQPVARAEVREAEKVERLGLSLSTVLTLLGRVATEADHRSLLPVDQDITSTALSPFRR